MKGEVAVADLQKGVRLSGSEVSLSWCQGRKWGAAQCICLDRQLGAVGLVMVQAPGNSQLVAYGLAADQVPLETVETADAGLELQAVDLLGIAGDDVDGGHKGAVAVEGRTGAPHHLHLLDVFHGESACNIIYQGTTVRIPVQ